MIGVFILVKIASQCTNHNYYVMKIPKMLISCVYTFTLDTRYSVHVVHMYVRTKTVVKI